MRAKGLRYKKNRKTVLHNQRPSKKVGKNIYGRRPGGLHRERCGRGCSRGRPPKLDKKVEEDLIAEVQRLRAENEY